MDKVMFQLLGQKSQPKSVSYTSNKQKTKQKTDTQTTSITTHVLSILHAQNNYSYYANMTVMDKDIFEVKKQQLSIHYNSPLLFVVLPSLPVVFGCLFFAAISANILTCSSTIAAQLLLTLLKKLSHVKFSSLFCDNNSS